MDHTIIVLNMYVYIVRAGAGIHSSSEVPASYVVDIIANDGDWYTQLGRMCFKC